MKTWLIGLLAVAVVLVPRVGRAVEASAAKGITLTIYDTGFAQVTESRSVNLVQGENELFIRPVPARMDAASVNLIPTERTPVVEVLEQRFAHDLGEPERLFERYLGLPVDVVSPHGTYRGDLVGIPRVRGPHIPDHPLAVRLGDDSALLFLGPEAGLDVGFPAASRQAFLEPTLQWKVQATQDGPQALRLSYLVEGMAWHASYEMTLIEQSVESILSVRVGVKNEAGGTFTGARVRLAATERGMKPSSLERLRTGAPRGAREGDAGPLRYGYQSALPGLDQQVSSLGVVQIFDLPRPLSLSRGEERFAQLVSVQALPVERFLVYDGVTFDRFRSNRRNDWSYGTESHGVVHTHLAFQNESKLGLGIPLPAGRFRLYERRRDGSLNLLGEDTLKAVAPGEAGSVLLGPARGLQGERERVSFTEVRPLHEYDESFEVRLTNTTAQDVTVRVVEHLYRWPEYEILKADTEYTEAGPQRIEFEPVVAAGATRTVSYTVRYRW